MPRPRPRSSSSTEVRAAAASMIKLLFTAGSAADPKGKEGLAQLAASMITEAGSKDMRIDEISKALYPMAGGFGDQVDKEMTTFTGVVHRDNWTSSSTSSCRSSSTPGFREEDFQRLKDAQLNALTQDLRTNNEEELGKEALQNASSPARRTATLSSARWPGSTAITLDDVKEFVDANYTRANVTVGLSGDVPRVARAAPHHRPWTARTRRGCEEHRPARGDQGRPAVGSRGRDHREGDARHRDLLRPSHRGDPQLRRLRRAEPRARVARRASRLIGPSVPAHPRGARHELRRLRVHRILQSPRRTVLPRARASPAARSSSRSGSVRSCRRTRTWRCASPSTSCRS